MKNPVWRAGAVSILSVALINLGLVTRAPAAIIDTGALVASNRNADLATIRAQLDRADVRAQMERLGVDPANVEQRVANLSDSELHRLAADMQSAPAGGDVLALVGAVFIVLLVLELVGVIDIFKKVPG